MAQRPLSSGFSTIAVLGVSILSGESFVKAVACISLPLSRHLFNWTLLLSSFMAHAPPFRVNPNLEAVALY